MKRALSAVLLATAACHSTPPPQPPQDHADTLSGQTAVDSTAPAKPAAPILPAATHKYDAISRAEFNRWAVRTNTPVYWIEDTNHDNAINADEVAKLLFYPTEGRYVDHGVLTPEFEGAYEHIVAASKAPPPDAKTDDGKRRTLVGEDLDQGRASLVRTDFVKYNADDKAFVRHMLAASRMIDSLYAQAIGSEALASKVPADDEASQSLFRRNHGPRCVGPATEGDPACSAIPGAPREIADIYPPVIDGQKQGDPGFCAALEKHNDPALIAPFSVVVDNGGKLVAVPYTEHYKTKMSGVATELDDAAAAIKDPDEAPLVAYLKAAAQSFRTNDWQPADEAWSKMTVKNSKWYVRVAPDETYWEPCSHKAGWHLTFARINQGSIAWQDKLAPIQQEMETAVAKLAGPPYKTHPVSFHLPDFIDIITNAGDDRNPLGATIGESLPNWGPVVAEGRGRTVAMVNLYSDPDSREARRQQAISIIDADFAKTYTTGPDAGLLTTILHEVTHNLGPAHEYKVKGRADGLVFGGPLSSMLEEFKAQSGGMYLVEMLRKKGLITDEQAQQTYTDAVVWAFGHISQGMYDASHKAKPYGNLAAIQMGFLIDHGALQWDPKAKAANGTDTGAFVIHREKIVPAVEELMKQIAGIKSRGDVAAAKALIAKYVDSDKVLPHKIIAERFLRYPKASFVYAVDL
jgi:hypothetical protein